MRRLILNRARRCDLRSRGRRRRRRLRKVHAARRFGCCGDENRTLRTYARNVFRTARLGVRLCLELEILFLPRDNIIAL